MLREIFTHVLRILLVTVMIKAEKSLKGISSCESQISVDKHLANIHWDFFHTKYSNLIN